jgi:hypothetical protein
VLIVLAALGAKRPGPVATRDIERVLEQGGDAPVYGPNLRASCRRMEAAGWLRTLRAPNLQLAVELTQAGRGIAEPLYQEAREAEKARQRLTDVRRLPLRQTTAGDAVELQLDDGHQGSGLRDPSGRYHLPAADGCRWHTPDKEGDPLQVASWYQACFDAGLPVTVQVNESRTDRHHTRNMSIK